MLSMNPNTERGEPLPELLKSTDEFAARTGRPVALSYLMLDGMDTQAHAEALLQHMQGRKSSHIVNLIQYHSELDPEGSCGSATRPSSPGAIRQFMSRLQAEDCQVSFGQFCEIPASLAE